MSPTTTPAASPVRPLYFEAADEGREKVRTAVEAVQHEMALVAPGGKVLQEQWSQLVKLLAMEPAHEVRACSHCGSVGMTAATTCHHCWAKLTPPAHVGASAAQPPGGAAVS